MSQQEIFKFLLRTLPKPILYCLTNILPPPQKKGRAMMEAMRPKLRRQRGNYPDQYAFGQNTSDHQVSLSMRTICAPHLHGRPRIRSLRSLPLLTSPPRALGGLSPSVVRRVCEYIDANLQTNIDLTTLSEIAGLSIWHFCRAFKQSVGVTPHKYLIHRRLDQARPLVADTNLPLAQIAIGSGFSDQSHFIRRFNQYFGLSPGAFRRSQR